MPLILLYYHRVSVDGSVGVSLDVFVKQMEFLSENAKVCDLDQVCEYIDKGVIPERMVVALTFDDGFADAYYIVEPVLRKFRIIGTVFVTTSRVSEGGKRLTIEDYWNGRCSLEELPVPSPLSTMYRDCTFPYRRAFMTCEEILACDRGNLRVESHGHLHFKYFSYPLRFVGRYTEKTDPFGKRWWLRHIYRHLKEGLPVFEMKSSLVVRKVTVPLWLAEGCVSSSVDYSDFVESEGDMKIRIERELRISKEFLESILNRKVYHIAWPWGEYSDLSVELAKKVGFEACYTTEKAVVDETRSRFGIPRIGATKQLFKFYRRFYRLQAGSLLRL